MIEWLRYVLTGLTPTQRKVLIKVNMNAIQEEETKETLQRIRRIPNAFSAAIIHSGDISDTNRYTKAERAFELAAEAVRLVEETSDDKRKMAEWFTNHFDKGIFLTEAENAYKKWLEKK